MLNNKSGLVWLWLTVILLIVDQVSKYVVSTQMELYQSIELLPVFNLTYVHNYGAAFSFLSEAGGWQRWFFSIIALSISVLLTWWLKKLPAKNIVLCSAYSLVLAGALGNLYDRLTYGYVIDFIHVYYDNWHFPAFNIADSAICIGAGLLLLDAFRDQKSEELKHD
ncbi:signal peptidase II [Pseudoalteromonas tunicata]|uniref:Lipoprotein signal peptidase n=1 Tax=Pseudoalteromonas tunicata D2 TaxID=87626 RepID=A4C628_9GAMM|nr:signal peptidase II [Pseudoalteromonas tunicata]ATC95405.1 signal peptidase II [Pseudoalteromonas tunicata]AXT30986.1 lipoprotein signal peptidase [Pseudoalteromonas tunicata]EAR29432.1 lipoprotein signal peptidase (SPase II)(Prolipoprotein signal peptidase) [Pseudoalteromonas tunicata D2]MDP4985740.1 signal peptidase II [Pseudoalteromonas tunicata]MDP5213022.1 signal peptidase II [Pseudoalteromonas tunicata]